MRKRLGIASIVLMALVSCSSEKAVDIAASPSAAASAGPQGVALQVREVVSSHANGCTESTTNPDAAKPASLLGPNRACFSLKQASLEVRQASATGPAGDDQSSSDQRFKSVPIQLRSADAHTFGEITTKNVGKPVALVMFGRVLAAPDVQVPIESGGISLTGLTADEANQVVAAWPPETKSK
jgi:preprotein translocase subunit SecD